MVSSWSVRLSGETVRRKEEGRAGARTWETSNPRWWVRVRHRGALAGLIRASEGLL